MKNMFRLDSDGSGSVSFIELVIYSLFRVTSYSNVTAVKCLSKEITEMVKCHTEKTVK